MSHEAIEQIRHAAQQCIDEWRCIKSPRTFQWVDDKFPQYHTGDIEINYYFHINWIHDWNDTNRKDTAVLFLEQWIKKDANLKRIIEDTDDWKLVDREDDGET